jgi:hypothetical protein
MLFLHAVTTTALTNRAPPLSQVQTELLKMLSMFKSTMLGSGHDAAVAAARANDPDAPQIIDHTQKSDAFDAEEVEEYALYLGMDLTEDRELLYIAEMAMAAPLPSGWTEHDDADGREFYYNTVTGVCQTVTCVVGGAVTARLARGCESA